MSIQTRADDYIDAAREAVAAADIALAECVTEVFARKCWGHDEFREGYEAVIREASAKMREIRDALG